MGSTPTTKKKSKTGPVNYITWFEIPAVDFQQAVRFYNHIFDMEMEQSITDTNAMAFFPDTHGVGGAVISGPGSIPGETGPLIYLNGGNDLNLILNKVEEAGGRIIMTKTLINEESGYYAVFIDSQGNKLALHSKN